MNYFGCSGYIYDHWRGLFYPAGLSKSKWFDYYASKFNTVEINYSFYRFPSAKAVKRWYSDAPKGFKYTLKASRFITHVKKFKNSKSAVNRFYKMADLLKEKLGCILFQLPPNLKYSEKKLNEICKQLNPKYKNVIEFRHSSWFNADVYKKLKQNKIIFCIISYPGLPEDKIKTVNDIYVRFHGKPILDSSNYSKTHLKDWAKQIKKLKPKNIWWYFNNDALARAPKNCLELKKII